MENAVEPEFLIYYTFNTTEHSTFYWDPKLAVVGSSKENGDNVHSGGIVIFSAAYVVCMLMLVFVL